jgi:hypothetical protein
MTGRKRFIETMAHGAPDRVPYFEEGLRDGVLEAWRKEGLPKDADLAAMFHFDHREKVPVNLDPHPGIRKWPVTRDDLKAFRRRFDPDSPGRLPRNWASRVKSWKTRDFILELSLHPGFFLAMGVEKWTRFREAIYQVAEAPSTVREMLEIRGQCAATLADRVLSEVEIDFASFSEPIGGNDRPLLSPRTYTDVVLRSYRPILDVLRRHNVKTIVMVTYANPRVLLPAMIDAGFNCLWACEANMEAMDYLDIRREFGRDLRLIGGIDLDALLADKKSVRREMTKRVPALLEQGGYIPLADGRVRENVPFENYTCYRRLLEQFTQ